MELGLFIAWHVEAFARQKYLQPFGTVLEAFRANRKGAVPIQDWQLDKEHMQAIRERVGDTPRRTKRKGTVT